MKEKTKSSTTLPSASAKRLVAVSRISKQKPAPAKASPREQFSKSTKLSRGNASTYAVPIIHLDRSQSALMENYGNHPLHMDALQGDVEEIEHHVHRRGFLPDCHNSENSTPLMFACLFGQKRAARILVEAGASKKARDIFGHSALDYTMNCRCMDQRRQLYSFVRKDDIRKDCSKVADFLGRSSEIHQCATAHHPTSRHKDYFSIQMSGQTISLTVPLIRWKVPRPFPKAIGFILQNGHLGILSSAVSGWRNLDSENPPCTIDNVLFTKEVMRISRQWKHDLPNHSWDFIGNDSKPGQYSASHAEKKLIAHYICRLLLQEFGETDTRKLRLLKDFASGEEVPIYLNMKPCANCKAFAEKAEDVTGIKFHFQLTHNWALRKCNCTDNHKATDVLSREPGSESESSTEFSDVEEAVTEKLKSRIAVVIPNRKSNYLQDKTKAITSQSVGQVRNPHRKRKAESKCLNPSESIKRARLSPAVESTTSRKILDKRVELSNKSATRRPIPYIEIKNPITTPKKDAARKSARSLIDDSLDDLESYTASKPPTFVSKVSYNGISRRLWITKGITEA